jgi:hypothetical protein
MTGTTAKVARLRRARTSSARVRVSKCLLALALALLSAPAFAQGCAMCYATAKATPKDGQLAINRGILVMLFPPLAAMTLGVGAAFRYGKKRDSEKD